VVSAVRATTGAGVEGIIDARAWRLGRPEFVGAMHGIHVPPAIESKVGAGDTVIALGNEEGWQAFFRLSDALRPEAAAMSTRLAAAGIKLSIFSGDAAAAAARVGAALGIPDARGGLSPEDKHVALKALQDAGGTVAMVGDGVNDAPVLAQAQVSIAMSGGADLARANADIVLLGNDLQALPQGLALARRTVRIVRQNLVWAFAYNFLGHPAGHGRLGDALDGRHRHVGQFPAGGTQCAAPAKKLNGHPVSPDSLVPGAGLRHRRLFWWSLKSGQYEDLEGPGYRILMDDDRPDRQDREPAEEKSNDPHVDSDQGTTGCP
jgi:cbb3-type cytochrome oxidase maturation protein